MLLYALAMADLGVAVVATSLLTFDEPGLIVAAILLVVIGIIRAARSRGKAAFAVACIAVACLGVGLLLPGFSRAGPASWRAMCHNNLKQIGIALYNYREANGSFPPVHLSDKSGKPAHSWRVLILPYEEEERLYKQYDFKEPWDAPKNKSLLRPMTLYRCPCESDVDRTTTSYVAVVGPDSPWGERWPVVGPAAEDERMNPAMVVEVAGADIPWTEPRDMALEQASNGLGPGGISSRHMARGGIFRQDAMTGAHVLFADGSVRFVRAGTPPEVLAGALAGDPAQIRALDTIEVRVEQQVIWSRWVSFGGLVAAVLLMLVWPRPSVADRREEEIPLQQSPDSSSPSRP
jgi:prepilin-type processing-associated H-X9-DG protein